MINKSNRNHSLSKWDKRFLDLAEIVASWSKDPSTKVGAVITKGNNIISVGFNGFAKGVDDSEERYTNRNFKYPAVIHAEENAILFAKQDLTDCTIYTWPMPPCAGCASKIIQTGIKRVVSIQPNIDQLKRWKDSIEIANSMYNEVDVEVNIPTINTDLIEGYHERYPRNCIEIDKS